MKSAQIISQAVQYQLALLPKTLQQQYANLLIAAQAFPDLRMQWLLYVYGQLYEHFQSGTALVFPPYLRNKKMLEPPPARMQLQQVLFNVKNVQVEMRDLYASAGRSVAIQLAVAILGREKPCDMVYIDRKIQSEPAEHAPEVDARQVFIQRLETQNAELYQQIAHINAELAQKTARIYDIEHIELLYRYLVKKQAAHSSGYDYSAVPTLAQSTVYNTHNNDATTSEAREFDIARLEMRVEQADAYIQELKYSLEAVTRERAELAAKLYQTDLAHNGDLEEVEKLRERVADAEQELKEEQATSTRLRYQVFDLDAQLHSAVYKTEEVAAQLAAAQSAQAAAQKQEPLAQTPHLVENQQDTTAEQPIAQKHAEPALPTTDSQDLSYEQALDQPQEATANQLADVIQYYLVGQQPEQAPNIAQAVHEALEYRYNDASVKNIIADNLNAQKAE